MVDCFVNSLADWLVGWLFGWLVDMARLDEGALGMFQGNQAVWG